MTAEVPVRTRALPRVRKAWGTSANVDGEVLQYTEGEMSDFGDACYQDGHCDALAAVSRALAAAGMPIGPASYSAAQRAEDDAWAEYRAGRGPHPVRR
ncbi:hypothetical protein N5K27_28270 [Pigmentiphaga sp. GD03639]|uniref:hypothetical protein n=1 Tax=Pigmentiphaga sp. GD03639 TaxID=2975354 RepID=UPI002446C6F5|nr:hypothetical protein [Pigmentiphaga sp. GD03639]MDH2240196.1 hypothetical protein [Pigmentiphaga sp. GD03639]